MLTQAGSFCSYLETMAKPIPRERLLFAFLRALALSAKVRVSNGFPQERIPDGQHKARYEAD